MMCYVIIKPRIITIVIRFFMNIGGTAISQMFHGLPLGFLRRSGSILSFVLGSLIVGLLTDKQIHSLWNSKLYYVSK